MKSYQLQTWANNPILRAISKEVNEITSDIQQFCTDLQQMMYDEDGVGLAAPQIGHNIKIISTTQRKKDKLTKETIMINPKILRKSDETAIDEEACLSLPKIIWSVKRHISIKVTYLDLKGNKHTKKLKHLNARIIQHEIDHLDGILFIDKLHKKPKKD